MARGRGINRKKAMTRAQSARDIPHSRVIARSKRLVTGYKGLDSNKNVVFRTRSETTDRRIKWVQRVRINTLTTLKRSKSINLKSVRTALAEGTIKIHCNCPAYLYWGYKYITTTMGANVGRGERRRPKIRNPKLEGIGCKHMIQVLRVLPFHMGDLVRDFRKKAK